MLEFLKVASMSITIIDIYLNIYIHQNMDNHPQNQNSLEQVKINSQYKNLLRYYDEIQTIDLTVNSHYGMPQLGEIRLPIYLGQSWEKSNDCIIWLQNSLPSHIPRANESSIWVYLAMESYIKLTQTNFIFIKHSNLSTHIQGM